MIESGGETYLRVGDELFRIYGDEVRGWSPHAGDVEKLADGSPFVYASLDELFFALVNLKTTGGRVGC
ncbi:MAG: hypothetical protein E6J75_17830 [Deltaproteobacteria bacterium]|nr:MAG: hypothetical protein E6J79_00740 [Deltaproteobacteria bacterium]TMA51793.1 MAG: hypothetical protein E6J75_17830 [Deltaproteobacteria bacterium]